MHHSLSPPSPGLIPLLLDRYPSLPPSLLRSSQITLTFSSGKGEGKRRGGNGTYSSYSSGM